MATPAVEITKRQYETLAAWRLALRRFLHFSYAAARGAGIPPQQHQALLAIKGYPGRDYVTVGELADQLMLKHHSAVGIVDRLAQKQLVRRGVSPTDRRRIEVRLTPKGEALVEQLSASHLDELRQLRPELERVLSSIDFDPPMGA